MKRRSSVTLLVLTGAVVCAVLLAQTRTAEEETLRARDDQERQAVLNRDTAALERLWSDDFVVNSPGNQVLIGKRAVLAHIEQGFIHYASFERQVELVRVRGNVGIVMGAEIVQPIGKAPMAGQTVHRRFTDVWKLEAGAWREIARHANVIRSR
jgi:ketosteroid isomerase-like protein